MKQKTSSRNCPCGLPLSYDDCCGRYIEHAEVPAPTAQALMRSRYSAYTLLRSDYLLATWHPECRPDQLDLTEDSARIKWLGLEIIHCDAGLEGDLRGVVEFLARYKVGGRAERLHEVSRFVCLDGRWYYRDGDIGD
jgi:SEC-C motif-containing protein